MTAPPSRRLSRRSLFGRSAADAPAPVDPAAPVRVTDACFAERGIYCRSCSESCSETALRIAPRLGGRAEVIIHAERCTGCGECIAVCPADAIEPTAAARDTQA